LEAKSPPRTLQEAIALPVLEEAAHLQRAKVMGLPAPEQEISGLEREEIDPVSFDKQAGVPSEEIQHKRQDAISLPPNKDPLVALQHEQDVATLHVTDGKAGENQGGFKEKIMETKNSLEESAHNARLRVDAALEKKFGYQAEKIQTEIEKARLSAISDTARVAELLQAQFGHCASDLRDQQQQKTQPFVGDHKADVLPEGASPALIGENVVAQRVLDAHEGLEDTGHKARVKIDNALERQFGGQVEKLKLEGEKARDSAIDETARTAELLQGKCGECAASFREQLQQGVTPNYH